MSGGELILYTAEDGSAAIQLRAEGGTVWLTQAQIATLFDTTPQNITQHTKVIYSEGELSEGATCKELLQVRQEGGRAVNRGLKQYNLDMIYNRMGRQAPASITATTMRGSSSCSAR